MGHESQADFVIARIISLNSININYIYVIVHEWETSGQQVVPLSLFDRKTNPQYMNCKN